MNQKDLIDAIANAGEVSKADTEHILKTLGAVVATELQAGGDVTLPGIGKLSVKHSPARAGRNPATGETIQIAAKKKPAFSAAKALKDALS